MEFTGERFIPTEQGKIRLEHYHRYAALLHLVSGKEVLDVACGEGYGSFFMADIANAVVGIDISDEAVKHASAKYKKSNLTFRQGSVTNLHLADASFDVVVSFETIEHLSEQSQMLAEIRRVLRYNGVLVISSPNRPIYSEESGEHNEFHVKELDFCEFDELLKVQFPIIQYYGQRMLMGSVIQPIDGGQNAFQAWHDNGENLKPNGGQFADPVYFLAVCGANEALLPSLDASVVYPQNLDLMKLYVGFAKWAKSLSNLLSERDGQIANMLASPSWRITRPLREAMRWLSMPKKQTAIYLNKLFRVAKQNHHLLPLSYKAKMAIYRRIHTISPSLFGLSIAKAMPLNLQKPVDGSGDLRLLALTSLLEGVKTSSLDAIQVSIIIPVHGKIDYTLRCLASIASAPPCTTFEVIVVDDCSPDNSFEVLSKIRGIRLLRNKENQGFICSCNTGANAARGEYLYFLNNDTEVTVGWLDELLRTFHEFPGTGLAGSKLIYPDSRLQEAGGIIWQNGSAWNFGRFKDPLQPIYNYAREVDYCSGASIMIPKLLFDELEGFDKHYLPAYGEDSDLALKIRSKGYRVIYQPLSTVIHFEGITSGIDTTQGAKAYQVENSKKLFERWQHRLVAHQPAGTDVDKAKDRRATRRVLVLDHLTPTPNQDAGSVTVFNLLLLLREMDFQVTFIPENNFLKVSEYTAALQRAGIEMLYAPHVTSVKQHLKACGERYDLALLFRPGLAERQIKTIRKYCPKAKVLFHTVDLHHLRMSREAAIQLSIRLLRK
jgi:O-antigen biosynthesis protein